MESTDGFGALVEHLERTTRLSRAESERVVAEVLDYFSESLEAFITRRHGELQGEELRNQLCYAHLYLGLYHEALGHADKAKDHMLKAATDYKMDHYMGKCAQVHVKMRGWEK